MADHRSQIPSRKLVLASASPRRRELLRAAGYDFVVEPPRVDEVARPEEEPAALAERLAREKCEEVAGRIGGDACVLAADTIVVIDGDVLGKPSDVEDAAAMLLRLAGRRHRVITGYCVRVGAAPPRSGTSTSEVRMRRVGAEEARAYAASGEPLDKAGGYAVQGEGGRFVEAIVGLRSNVIGLPLEDLAPLLADAGVTPG